MEDILSSLNSRQKQAVMHTGSPLLILAGPGSGKTTVITKKIAWLIHELQYPAPQILAMTFTNKAAKEMAERVRSTVGETGGKPYVSTFHSFGAYILRRFCEEAQLERSFQIYDADDQLALLKQVCSSVDTADLRKIRNAISAAKDHGLSDVASDEELKQFVKEPEVYRKYEQLKKSTGNVDFGDLLLLPYRLLARSEIMKKHVRQWWQWFLIDEYQDTNRVQFLLLQELCGHTANLCVVGDDDQSIYKFRGAVVENILTFHKLMPHTTVIKLEQNYRSTPQILNLANAVIEPNRGRHGKKIFSTLPARDKPVLVACDDENEECAFTVDIVEKALQHNKQSALFFRTNAQTRGYETALRAAGISYTLVGATGFFLRAEVKDIIALARVFKNPYDIIGFLRIANKPSRGIGDKSLKAVASHMRQGNTWREAFAQCGDDVSGTARKGFLEVEEYFAAVEQEKKPTIGDVCELLVRLSGILALYKNEKKVESVERVRNIDEFLSYAFEFENTDEGWNKFLEQISLAETAPREQSSQVQLMTLHRSKGLEFDTVIICGVEEDIIPMTYMDSGSESLSEVLEEERRLFYVGITRAKQQLYFTTSRQRRRYGNVVYCSPSSFLEPGEGHFDVVRISVESNNTETTPRHHPGQRSVAAAGKTTSVPPESEQWSKGERVHHKDYGAGFVREVKQQGAHTIIRVEFDSESEGDFIPKFDSSISRIE